MSSLEHYATLLEQCYDFEPHKYVKEFSSLQGVQCLVSEILLVTAARQSHLGEILALVLGNPRLVCMCAVTDLTQTSALFCGSRLLTVVSSTTLDQWYCHGLRYAKWLAYQLLEFQNIPAVLLDRACKLGFDVYGVLFSDFDKFLKCYKALSPTSKLYVLRSWLQSTTLQAPAIAAIWKELAFDKTLKMIRLAYKLNIQVQRAAVIWPSDLPQVLPALLEEWGSQINLSQATVALQTAQTQILLSIATQLDKQQALEASRLEQFSDGVSNHLASQFTRVREMGTIVAQVYAKQAGEKLNFDLDYEHSYFISKENIVALDDAFEPLPESENQAQTYLEPSEKATTIEDTPMDSDDEEEEAEPPVYVRDLLAYLQSTDYGKHHAALEYGPDLVSRKARFGTELTHYAPELLVVLAGLTDQYSVADFAGKRQRLLVALVVSDPSLSEKVVHLLSGGDYSLSQRISLMNALVEAARELANHKAPAFATPQLPGALHNAFYSEQDLSIELNGLLLDAAPSDRPSINKFAKLAASFFYPLAALRSKDFGDYTILIYQHWLKTLGLLVYYSYPSNDMPGMASQLVSLLVSARATAPEAVYVCLLLLIDVCPGSLLRNPLIIELCEWCAGWQSQADPKTQKLGATAYYKLSKMLQDAQKKVLNAGS